MWLNGKRNFEAGVKLYELYGTDKLLKKLFAERPVSKYKEQTLASTLEQLLTQKIETKETALVVKQKQIERTVQEKNPDSGWSKNMDEIEAALHAKWKPLFVEMMGLTARIEETAIAGLTDPYKKIQAGQMALRILKLDEMCDDLYNKRDEYLTSGKFPIEKTYGELCIDPNLWPKKLTNHQRYFNTYKKKVEADPANLDAAEQMKKQQWFIDEYKKLLNMK